MRELPSGCLRDPRRSFPNRGFAYWLPRILSAPHDFVFGFVSSPIALMIGSIWLMLFVGGLRKGIALAIAVPAALFFAAFQALYKAWGGDTQLSMRSFAICVAAMSVVGTVILLILQALGP